MENTAFENQPTEDNVNESLIVAFREAAQNADGTQIHSIIEQLHPSDSATLFRRIPLPELRAAVEILSPTFEGEILTYLDDELRAEIIDILGTKRTGEMLSDLESDDAVFVIEDLDVEDQQELLDAIRDDARADVEEGLSYPEESAGRLMQKRFVSVPEFWDVGKVIDYLRAATDLPEDFYEIIVVNPRFHPVGTVMISRILQNDRSTPLNTLMKQDIHPIATHTDQEEVAEMFHRYGVAEAPVVNESGRTVGVITIDDIVTVIKEEEEEDFMRAGGIIDRDLHAGLMQTVRQRLPWLCINLITASLAAWVISQFEATIEQMVTLAVLMPVIASLAGNAGIQSVTISVRGIATKEFQRHNALPIIRKETFTNMINGIALSLLTTIAIWVIYGDMELAGIFAIATIGTLTLAGLSGSFIPLLLSRIGIDPAIASGVFLTTVTDILSFFSFLGLAAWFLL